METRSETLALFVGEGDFSFSADYITKSRHCNEKIYASCLSDTLTERQKKNIEIIQENGGFVYTDVDATCLESHPGIKNLQFSKIFFNFPHIPGKMNIRKNRQLLEQFFMSARKILEYSGTIWVTLCQGQGGTEIEKIKRKWCDTWQVVSLAASASLILYRIQVFNAEACETYKCTGFRGLEKPFNTNGALTHIFKSGPPFHLNSKSMKNYLDADLYIQNCETLYRNNYRNLCHPPFKVLSVLNNIVIKIYPTILQETINNLLTCRKMFSLNSNNNSVVSVMKDFCENCVKNLFFEYLNKRTCDVMCINCSLCCIKIIDIHKDPLSLLVSYFSNDTENLLLSLPTILKNFKQVYSLKDPNDMLTIQDDFLNNKKIIQTIMHDVDKSSSKEFTVKCVLNIYAKYTLNQGNEFFFFSDVDFLISKTEFNEVGVKRSLKIGTALQIHYKFRKYTCVLFNLNRLAYLKYHITDYRTLFSENSFYTSQIIWGGPVEIFRPLSLYAPTYTHDISFYVHEDFCENNFFMVVRNIIGDLIKSLTLIDSYYDEKVSKHSRCYRFVYQSCHQVLSKDKANVFHTDFVRKALENSLNISLR